MKQLFTRAKAADSFKPWRTPRISFAAIGLVCATASAELVQNGSFELPETAAGSRLVANPFAWAGGAWVSHPNAGGSIGIGFTWPQAPDGSQYVDIGDTGSFALSQSFTLKESTVLSLSWKDNTALFIVPGFQTSPYTVRISDGASNVIASASFDAYHSNGAWQTRAMRQVLAAGNYTLTFTSNGFFGGTNTLIDAVSSVPEPATAFLLLAGSVILIGSGLTRKINRPPKA